MDNLNAIRIEDWAIVCRRIGLYCSPEQSSKHLCGKVQNHPACPSGKSITTSAIIGRRGKFVVTKSGSLYDLGNMRSEFAAQFPDATERLFDMIPEI